MIAHLVVSSNGGVTHAQACAMTQSEAQRWYIIYGEAAGGKYDWARQRFLTYEEQQQR